MTIGAELGHYFVQTHIPKSSKDSLGVEPPPPNSPLGTPLSTIILHET